jgi:hypothetical protein
VLVNQRLHSLQTVATQDQRHFDMAAAGLVLRVKQKANRRWVSAKIHST